MRLRPIADRAVALLVRAAFALLRALGPDRAPAFGGFVARNLGPWTRVQRRTLDNIRQAFPGLPDAEHRRIARAAWDNLGRTACEYVHLDTIWDFDPDRPRGRIRIAPEIVDRFLALRDDGKPALIFAAHLANWELPAIAAARHGLAAAVLYRTPNNPYVARDIVALRSRQMGQLIPAGIVAPLRMMQALEDGLHVGMLIDQRFGRGPVVEFFGRPAASNPLIAHLARRFDCPVHGARAIREPDGGYRLDVTEAIELPRDARGRVDIPAATALMNRIVEGWVREHPGQWLWMHAAGGEGQWEGEGTDAHPGARGRRARRVFRGAAAAGGGRGRLPRAAAPRGAAGGGWAGDRKPLRRAAPERHRAGGGDAGLGRGPADLQGL